MRWLEKEESRSQIRRNKIPLPPPRLQTEGARNDVGAKPRPVTAQACFDDYSDNAHFEPFEIIEKSSDVIVVQIRT